MTPDHPSDSETKPWETPELLALFLDTVAQYKAVENVSCVDIGFATSSVPGTPRPVTADALAVRVHFDDTHSTEIRPEVIRSESARPVVIGLTASYHRNNTSTTGAASAPFNDRIARQTTVQPGLQIRSNENTSAVPGTLGLLVKRRGDDSPSPYVLSCWHVLGDLQTAANDPRHTVLQGPHDDEQVVATLVKSVLNEHGDMAIARVTMNPPVLARRQLQAATIGSVRAPRLGDSVVKSGATTGVTCGVIDGIGVYMDRSRNPTNPMLIRCFRVSSTSAEKVSDFGDSGSVWYDGTTHAGVGLHFAGTPEGRASHENYAIAAHLDRVMAHLDIDLW